MSASVDFEHSMGFNPIANGLHTHANGQNFVYSTGGNVLIGDLTDPHSQRFLRKHDDKITCLTLSPTGRFISSGQRGKNSNVLVWDYDAGEVIWTFEEHDREVAAVAFSHDEKVLATLGGKEDGKLILWDMSNGMIIAQSLRLSPGTCCIQFGGFVRDVKRRDTDHYIFATGGEGGMSLWDLDPYSGELELTRMTGDERRVVTDLDFSVDRDFVYGATTSGDFAVASVKARRVASVVPACKKGLNCVHAVPDGVLLGGGDSSVKYFDNDMVCRRECTLDGSVIGLSLSADFTEVVASTAAGTVYRINLATMQHITIAESHTGAINAVAFSPGTSDKLATASVDGTIKVWDLAEYMVISTAHRIKSQGPTAVPLSLGMSDIILSGWSDGKVLAHDIYSGDFLWSIDNAHFESVTALCVSHNNRFLLTGGSQGEVRLWELRSRELISHLKEHTGVVKSLALFDDDATALSTSRDRCCLRWDLRQERRTFCNMQRMGGINAVCLSKDESNILTVGQEHTLTYWGVGQEDAIHKVLLNDDFDEGRCLGRSNDGTLVATGGTEGVVRLFGYDSGAQCASSIGHSGCINGLAFSGDDKQVVTGGEDGCLFIWNIFTE